MGISFKATGELIWSQPSGGGDSPPTVADMDEDGLPEILFGNFSGEIRILNGEDGSLAKSILATPFSNEIQPKGFHDLVYTFPTSSSTGVYFLKMNWNNEKVIFEKVELISKRK